MTGGVSLNLGIAIGGVAAGGAGGGTITPSNILLNGDFANGTANWTGFGFDGKSVVAQKAVLLATSQFATLIQATALFATGKYYDVTYTVSGYVAGSVQAYFDGGTQSIGTTRSANGTYLERLQAKTGNNSFTLITLSAAPNSYSLDDVSVVGPYNTP